MLNRIDHGEVTGDAKEALGDGATLALEEKGGRPEPAAGASCPAGGALSPQTQRNREVTSFNIRYNAAILEWNRDVPVMTTHPTNGDEALFQQASSQFRDRFIASYTKGLPLNTDPILNRLGETDPGAYCQLLRALRSGDVDEFEAIPLGSAGCTPRSLENPQGGLAFDLQGADSHAVFVRKEANGTPIGFPPAPAFGGAEIIAEIAENYWMALLRDVPFHQYGAHAPGAGQPGTADAARDLSRYSAFRGPKSGGSVTTGTLFRGSLEGDLVGPYLSQFLLHDIPYGSQRLPGQVRLVQPGLDYMTDEDNWRDVQRGCDFDQQCLTDGAGDPVFGYMRTGRDLTHFVHNDNDYYGFYNACLLLMSGQRTRRCEGAGGLGAPLASGLPYPNPMADSTRFPPAPGQSRNQIGINTFGPPHLKSLLLQVMNRALNAVWYQKFNVHRRLRPEAFAGRVHFRRTLFDGPAGGAAPEPRAAYPLNAVEYAKLGSAPAGAPAGTLSVLEYVFNHNQAQNAGKPAPNNVGTYLLPMAYAEGSPLHPSYGSGHSTAAGACVTLLKALFEDIPFDQLTTPIDHWSEAGGVWTPTPYTGGDLTVHGELNKLASNIGVGRNIAGVHYRSDYFASLLLGEQIAITILEDQFNTYNERYRIRFRRFDGTPYELHKDGSGPFDS